MEQDKNLTNQQPPVPMKPEVPLNNQITPEQSKDTPAAKVKKALPNFKLANVKMPKIKKPKIPKKIFAIVGVLILFLIIIVVVLSFFGRLPENPIIPTQASPTPTSTPTTNSIIESVYANDPDILKIEKNLKKFEVDLNSTNLREDTLRVPNLDWEINFE